MEVYNRIILGIDQSYARTGICLLTEKNGTIKKRILRSVALEREKNNTDRRLRLKHELEKILSVTHNLAKEYIVLVERIRHFSKNFLNINYIKSIGALNATIVDACNHYGIEVFSVDTRCWKSTVVGTSKPKCNKMGIQPEKFPTVRWCVKRGWEEELRLILPKNTRKKKGVLESNGVKFEYDCDAADAAAIAFFGFLGSKNKMQLER